MGAEGLKRVSQLALLIANYIKAKLKDRYHLPYDQPCMHECVFPDKKQSEFKVSPMDMAKRLMDYGFYRPTIYFPLVVRGAIMIEPTDTEPKENLDAFIGAMRSTAAEAETESDLLHWAPLLPKLSRLDKINAGRNPCLSE